jgi:hypothetical protein
MGIIKALREGEKLMKKCEINFNWNDDNEWYENILKMFANAYFIGRDIGIGVTCTLASEGNVIADAGCTAVSTMSTRISKYALEKLCVKVKTYLEKEKFKLTI